MGEPASLHEGPLGPPKSTGVMRVALFALLCCPGLFAAATLMLDRVTRRAAGVAFTSSGFLGGLVGLAAFFLGYVSILAWPGVVFLAAGALHERNAGWAWRVVVVLASLVATYSTCYWLYWFVAMPLGAGWGHAAR